MSLDDYLICPHICATVLLITILFRNSIGLFQNLTHKVGRLVRAGRPISTKVTADNQTCQIWTPKTIEILILSQYQYFGNKSQQSALSASSKSSTEPLFLSCVPVKNPDYGQTIISSSKTTIFHPLLLVKRQTLVTNILSNISYIFPTIFHVRKSRQPDNGLASHHHHHEQQILNRHLSTCVQCQKNGHKYIVIY